MALSYQKRLVFICLAWSLLDLWTGGAPRSHGLDLLYRMQERVVGRLLGSGLSSDLQAPSHRRDVASLSLLCKYHYRECSFELVGLVPPKLVTVRITHFSKQMHHHTVNSPICRTMFYQSSLFPLMNSFHQITISQHSIGQLTSSCWWSDQ